MTTTYTRYVYGVETNVSTHKDLSGADKPKTYRCLAEITDVDETAAENRANAIATRFSLIYPTVLVTENKQQASEEGALEPGYAI